VFTSRAAPDPAGELSDAQWGPTATHAPSVGHPLANAACAGRASPVGVWFADARIDALIGAAGHVLRTSQPDAVEFGLAQVRRTLESAELRVLHVVFAPYAARPLLLGLVRLLNLTPEPLLVHYSELWEVAGAAPRAAEAACICTTDDGERALADVSLAPRARAPEPLPECGLALDARLVLPPRERRELCFAYAAPESGDPTHLLVRAWRGDVSEELQHTVESWLEHLGSNPIAAYRGLF
jgi:hypothetical protein